MTSGPEARRGPLIQALFDPGTGSLQYIVADPQTLSCAIVDPVLDFDDNRGAVSTRNADRLLAMTRDSGFTVEWIIDTHPHADHLSAAQYLKDMTGARTATGERIVDVQALWRDVYDLDDLDADGRQWDELLRAGQPYRIGALSMRVMHSPGHTMSSVTLIVEDAAFVHDTLFVPDSGTARADFPGGSASSLWSSIQDILALPDATRIFVGHDYQPGGRALRWQSTVAEQRACNVHLCQCPDEAAYVAMRTARDATLPLPRLMFHALQVNIRAGRLPRPASNGTRYLKLPINVF